MAVPFSTPFIIFLLFSILFTSPVVTADQQCSQLISHLTTGSTTIRSILHQGTNLILSTSDDKLFTLPLTSLSPSQFNLNDLQFAVKSINNNSTSTYYQIDSSGSITEHSITGSLIHQTSPSRHFCESSLQSVVTISAKPCTEIKLQPFSIFNGTPAFIGFGTDKNFYLFNSTIVVIINWSPESSLKQENVSYTLVNLEDFLTCGISWFTVVMILLFVFGFVILCFVFGLKRNKSRAYYPFKREEAEIFKCRENQRSLGNLDEI